jgi:uncharacterized protein (DUF2141 family)
MNAAKSLPWLIIFFLSWGCARQTSPTGGPKDTIPPTLISALPKNGATNYSNPLIELEFDEDVILNNPKDQIIITPDVQKKFDIIAKKNKVKLEFQNKLQDTTTYALHFRAAVQDITEKNPVINLKLAFSTGHYIDSLEVKGKVYDPLTTTETKNITVAVYQQDTFNIFKHKPVYITQSDDKGNYSIEYLKPGKYFIYAIDDKNKNLVADSKTELYGFHPTPLTLLTKLEDINIPVQKLDARPLKLISARSYNTYFNIKASKNLVSYKLKTDSAAQIISSFAEDNSTIKVYNNLQITDSLKAYLTGVDSMDNHLDTTVFIKFSTRKSTPEAFNIKPGAFSLLHTKGTLEGSIKFNKPLTHINFDSIFFTVDSLNTVRFDSTNFSWDSLTNNLTIRKPIDKKLTERPTDPNEETVIKKTYELTMGRGAFISIEADSTPKQSSITIKPLYYEDMGVIIVKANTTEPNFLIQVLDKNFSIVRTVANKKNVSFEDLPPSEYQIRVVIDKNSDGKWTPGNYFLKRPAEQTVFYKSEKGLYLIKLKANFEIGPLLITF